MMPRIVSMLGVKTPAKVPRPRAGPGRAAGVEGSLMGAAGGSGREGGGLEGSPLPGGIGILSPLVETCPLCPLPGGARAAPGPAAGGV